MQCVTFLETLYTFAMGGFDWGGGEECCAACVGVRHTEMALQAMDRMLWSVGGTAAIIHTCGAEGTNSMEGRSCGMHCMGVANQLSYPLSALEGGFLQLCGLFSAGMQVLCGAPAHEYLPLTLHVADGQGAFTVYF